MQIASDLETELRPGDFAAHVKGRYLLLPQQLVDILAELNIRTAEDFLSLMQAFGASLGNRIGWTTAEVVKGREDLIKGLEGHVHPEILHPGLPESHPYGVVPAGRQF